MAYEHLPMDTRAVLGNADRRNACLNLGLLLERYAPWQRTQGGWDKPRSFGWVNNKNVDAALLAAHRARWEALTSAYGAQPFTLEACSRLAVGLGAHSVLETSLTLHRPYGYPIIPGSALKGLVRAVALFELADKLGVKALSLAEYWQRNPPDEKAHCDTPLERLEKLLEGGMTDSKRQQAWSELLGDEALPADVAIRQLTPEQFDGRDDVRTFGAVFGTLVAEGSVIFFGALPEAPPTLAAEIMTPHYSHYYRGENIAPHDADDPVPVAFLTVAEGSRFRFALGLTPRCPDSERVRLRQKATCWLKKGLREQGIGAKTAAGYGLFGKPTSTFALSHPRAPEDVKVGMIIEGTVAEVRNSGILVDLGAEAPGLLRFRDCPESRGLSKDTPVVVRVTHTDRKRGTWIIDLVMVAAHQAVE